MPTFPRNKTKQTNAANIPTFPVKKAKQANAGKIPNFSLSKTGQLTAINKRICIPKKSEKANAGNMVFFSPSKTRQAKESSIRPFSKPPGHRSQIREHNTLCLSPFEKRKEIFAYCPSFQIKQKPRPMPTVHERCYRKFGHFLKICNAIDEGDLALETQLSLSKILFIESKHFNDRSLSILEKMPLDSLNHIKIRKSSISPEAFDAFYQKVSKMPYLRNIYVSKSCSYLRKFSQLPTSAKNFPANYRSPGSKTSLASS